MLNFTSPSFSELSYARNFMHPTGIVGSDRVFGTFYFWMEHYNSKITNYDSYPIIRQGKQDFYYLVPLYTEKTKEMFEAVMEIEKGKKFYFGSVYEEDIPYIEGLFPGMFSFKENRNMFDYIYKTEHLALLSGRKYHSKRNHITKFKKKYSYEYTELTSENVGICNEIMDAWISERETPSLFSGEKAAIERAVSKFQELSLIGGFIKIDGVPCAFSISEVANEKMIVTHFEKALLGYDGLYAAINNEFAKTVLGKYEYINREEDMGIEGLRRAKLSYYPEILLKKYSVSLK